MFQVQVSCFKCRLRSVVSCQLSVSPWFDQDQSPILGAEDLLGDLQNIVLGNGQVTIQFVVDPLGIVQKESVVSQELSDSSHFGHPLHKVESDLILRFLDLLG